MLSRTLIYVPTWSLGFESPIKLKHITVLLMESSPSIILLSIIPLENKLCEFHVPFMWCISTNCDNVSCIKFLLNHQVLIIPLQCIHSYVESVIISKHSCQNLETNKFVSIYVAQSWKLGIWFMYFGLHYAHPVCLSAENV